MLGNPGLRRPMLVAGLAGLLAALGQAPVSLPWATLVGLGLAYMLYLGADRISAAIRVGWAFGAGYFAASLFWIVEPFLVDPLRYGWMAPFALIGMAGGMAIFWAAAAGLTRWLVSGGAGWAAALVWAFALALAELSRSYVLTGFPWALIGHGKLEFEIVDADPRRIKRLRVRVPHSSDG